MSDPSQQPSRIAPGYAPPEPSPNDGAASSDGSLSNAVRFTKESAARLTGGQVPCARSSLLYGAASGGVIAVMGMVAGRKTLGASYWGVAGGMLVSATSWEVCRRNRTAEQMRMRTIIEEHTRKKQPQTAQGTTAMPSSIPDMKAASAANAAKRQAAAPPPPEEEPLPTSRLFAPKPSQQQQERI